MATSTFNPTIVGYAGGKQLAIIETGFENFKNKFLEKAILEISTTNKNRNRRWLIRRGFLEGWRLPYEGEDPLSFLEQQSAKEFNLGIFDGASRIHYEFARIRKQHEKAVKRISEIVEFAKQCENEITLDDEEAALLCI